MAILGFLLALLLGFLGITSGSGPVKTAAVGATLQVTQADSGRQLRIGADQDAELHLSHRWRWGKPRVTGPATLQREDFVADPGYDAWLIEPTGKGTVTVRAAGRPGPRNLRLTIHVR